MVNQKIDISAVTKNEIDVLRTISIQTFTETFAHHNTENDMQKYISEKLSVTRLLEEFNTENSEFYFIRFENHIVGYLKLNSGVAQTEVQNAVSLEIERIYVKQEFHGKQYGHLLLQKAKDVAIQKQCEYIWLGVWERNIKAINFYIKQGFTEYDKHLFKLGNDEQTDIMMKLNLN